MPEKLRIWSYEYEKNYRRMFPWGWGGWDIGSPVSDINFEISSGQLDILVWIQERNTGWRCKDRTQPINGP